MGCVQGKGRAASASPSPRASHVARAEAAPTNADVVKKENGAGGAVEAVAGEEALPQQPKKERRRHAKPDPRQGSFFNRARGEQVAAGWPPWLAAVAGEAINGWSPRRADTFEKIDKIGQGTYSNVYKARDTKSGNIVALKKVRFDNLEPESVRFMAREILILRRLDHPNVVKLEGLVTSRMSCSLYLVFKYMEHDLAGLAASPDIKFTEPQVKCYMHQLLSGLEHCHTRGVLHRDIKGSNLLLDNTGTLNIADFGLASFFDPNHKQPMTSRVVTLWYRPPELLLGATDYGVGVDLWSAGCILAELLAGKPIMPGRTEVEQLHKIFKLCGSPSEEYWKKSKLPHATIFKPQQPYKRCIAQTFKDFPPSALQLIETLLAIDPADRKTATDALRSDFFTTEPYACDPASLPQYPPSKEMDAKRRDEEARRLRAAGRSNAEGPKKTRTRERPRAVPAPEANAELQVNIDRRRLITHANAKSKSEKFPPPHQDGALGFPLGSSHHIEPPFDGDPADTSFSTVFPYQKGTAPVATWSGPLVDSAQAANGKRKKKSGRSSKQPSTARVR
ncbi:Protein kinase superfamily protein [Rhynchospora pubera]|uniref:[RNA-polymerase]-subunit kinase n=1 Tax=Rhynchospora pubera TaxID=906938 RepID=A0AAV8CDU0_9POAL|nr:Protein kinase superfamily protein [Rhynchospora pubera]